MFFKQYNYKPRTNSQSSTGSTSGNPPKEETKPADSTTGAAVSAAVAGRRRSSATEKFSGLQGLKRGGPDDARKASWNEQQQETGILGGMWQNFTKGTGSS